MKNLTFFQWLTQKWRIGKSNICCSRFWDSADSESMPRTLPNIGSNNVCFSKHLTQTVVWLTLNVFGKNYEHLFIRTCSKHDPNIFYEKECSDHVLNMFGWTNVCNFFQTCSRWVKQLFNKEISQQQWCLTRCLAMFVALTQDWVKSQDRLQHINK